MPAISRGSRRSAPTPPDRRRHEFDPGRGRSGLAMRRFRCFACPRRHSLPCSSPIEVLLRMGIPGPLAPLPGCGHLSSSSRGIASLNPGLMAGNPPGFPGDWPFFTGLIRRIAPISPSCSANFGTGGPQPGNSRTSRPELCCVNSKAASVEPATARPTGSLSAAPKAGPAKIVTSSFACPPNSSL